MGDDRKGGVRDASEGGVSGEHPAIDPFQFLVGPTTSDHLNTLQLPLRPIFCWKVEDIRFDFDSSFVTFNPDGSPDPLTNPDDPTSDPAARPQGKKDDIRDELKVLADLVNANQGCPLSVFGHADPVGPAVDPDGYNKALSGRRATAIYALLISGTQPGTATSLWQQIANDEHWGDNQKNVMQQATNLPAGTSMAALISSYLPKICPQDLRLAPQNFLAQGASKDGKGDYQGCSSFNPLLIFSQTKEDGFAAGENDQDQQVFDARNLANAPNRRVMVLIFPKGSKVDPNKWPCPNVKGDKSGCIKRFWSNGQTRRSNRLPDKDRKFEETQNTFACRFYQRLMDRSPCDSIFQVIRIRLFDHFGQPIPNALYRLTLSGKELPSDTADQNGDIRLISPAVPAVCSIRWSRPLKESVTFTEEDDLAEGGGHSSEVTGESSASDSETGLSASEFGGFEYRRDVFIDVDGSVTSESSGQSEQPQKDETQNERMRRRLNNLGYSSPETLDGQIKAFQRDCGKDETGLTDQAEAELIRRHDQCDPPSPGKLRTLVMIQNAR